MDGPQTSATLDTKTKNMGKNTDLTKTWGVIPGAQEG